MLHRLAHILADLLAEVRAYRQDLRANTGAIDRLYGFLLRNSLAQQLGEDTDVTIDELATLWGVSTRTVDRIDKDSKEPFRLVNLAGKRRASIGAVRRYHRKKFGNG